MLMSINQYIQADQLFLTAAFQDEPSEKKSSSGYESLLAAGGHFLREDLGDDGGRRDTRSSARRGLFIVLRVSARRPY